MIVKLWFTKLTIRDFFSFCHYSFYLFIYYIHYLLVYLLVHFETGPQISEWLTAHLFFLLVEIDII